MYIIYHAEQFFASQQFIVNRNSKNSLYEMVLLAILQYYSITALFEK